MARWVYLGMGIALAATGVFFASYLWRVGAVALAMRDWTEVPCMVVTSRLEITADEPPKYAALVKYRFDWQGEKRMGDRVKRNDSPYSREEKARELCVAYPVGLKTVCHVNPKDPAQAFLKLDTLAPLYTLWFPLAFVIFGGGLVGRAVRGTR